MGGVGCSIGGGCRSGEHAFGRAGLGWQRDAAGRGRGGRPRIAAACGPHLMMSPSDAMTPCGWACVNVCCVRRGARVCRASLRRRPADAPATRLRPPPSRMRTIISEKNWKSHTAWERLCMLTKSSHTTGFQEFRAYWVSSAEARPTIISEKNGNSHTTNVEKAMPVHVTASQSERRWQPRPASASSAPRLPGGQGGAVAMSGGVPNHWRSCCARFGFGTQGRAVRNRRAGRVRAGGCGERRPRARARAPWVCDVQRRRTPDVDDDLGAGRCGRGG